MDGLQNIANHQISATKQVDSSAKASLDQVNQSTVVQQMQQQNANPTKKINSQSDVNELIKKMNDSLSPFNTSIKFGVDKQDTFYVSVIDTSTGKMIRRFPAEQATQVLPKMQELSGILFDTKG